MGTKPKIINKKNVKNYRIKDPRWTIYDKVDLYTGYVKLQGRQKKLKSAETVESGEKICNKLETLKANVKEFREVWREVQCGDKRRLHRILRDHKDLQLACGDHDSSTAYRAIFEDCGFKQRLLNELHYIKCQKIKEFSNFRLEWTLLINTYEDQNTSKGLDYKEQKVAYQYDKIIAKKQAAELMHLTLLFMIDVLEKDKYHFDDILPALEADVNEQREIMKKTKYLGQLAAKDLNNSKRLYKRMVAKVWKNMKERETSLKILRRRIDDLWSDIRLLVRVESNTKYLEMIGEKPLNTNADLEDDIQSLEKTFNQVMDVLLIRSYDEFLARFEEQARQKTRLLKLLEQSLDKRDLLLNKKNNAILILSHLKDSMTEANDEFDQYKASKKEMLTQLEIEKKRETDFTKLRKSRGALLINIKTALQNMLALMVCIKSDWREKPKVSKDKKTREKKVKKSEITSDSVRTSRIKLPSLSDDEFQLEQVDTDALNLLTEVTKRATILFNMSNIELSHEEEEKAKNLYQSYVAEQRSKALLTRQESEFKALTVEHEIIDSSIMSRADIKSQSKHLVDIHTKID